MPWLVKPHGLEPLSLETHRRGLQGRRSPCLPGRPSHPGRVRHLVVMRERPHDRSRQTLGIIPCPRSQGSSISDEKTPIPDRHPDPGAGHPSAVGRRLALWRSRKPMAPRQCRGDDAAATPGPGADAAADCDGLACLDRDGLTTGSAAIRPIFAGAFRHRDARTADRHIDCCGHVRDRSPGCQSDCDAHADAVTDTHTTAAHIHHPHRRSPPCRLPSASPA